MTNFDPQSGSSTPEPDPQFRPQPQYPAIEPTAQYQPGYPPSPYPPNYGSYGYAHPAHPAHPAGYAPYPAPPAAPPKPTRRKRALVGVGAAAVAAALVLGGYGIGNAVSTNDTVAGSASGTSTSGGTSTGGSSTGGSANGGTGTLPNPLFPGGTRNGSGSGSGSGTQSAGTTATSTQQAGIVTINSVLKYENAESAGTGMILSSDGEILTNNHVVNGATSVTVTVESTGKSYKADVVGTDPTDDIAVLQLRNASGLTTAKVGNASDVSDLGVGDKVTGVGNAGGTGTLTQVSGAVTALEQSITATDDSGSNAEKLTGLIEINAGIVSGDSGGPLYDADGTVIGIDTAAASTNGTGSTASQAYAIPIDDARKIADQIESGVETSSVHIGLPAFIGVGVGTDAGSGAAISSVLDGGPADDAGLTTGSTITAIGGTAVTGADSLKTVLGKYQPGEKVKISWTDTSGAGHTATVTLATGPAD